MMPKNNTEVSIIVTSILIYKKVIIIIANDTTNVEIGIRKLYDKNQFTVAFM